MLNPQSHCFRCVGLFALTLSVACAAGAETVELAVETGLNDLAIEEVAGYSLVTLKTENATLDGAPGTPWLPSQSVYVLLPAGCQPVSVEAAAANTTVVSIPHDLYPAQPPVTTAAAAASLGLLTPPDPAVYQQTTPIRPLAAELVGGGFLRGHAMAHVTVFPLDYTPATRTLVLRQTIRLCVHTAPVKTLAAELLDASDEAVFGSQALRLAANANDYGRFGYAFGAPAKDGQVDPGTVEYLIITDASLKDAFAPLVAWKKKKGVPAEIVDTASIGHGYPGSDMQQKIRACIIDYVTNHGALWVLLGGDDTLVPDRDCYVECGGYVAKEMPTDLYYACLDDANWDDDGDTQFGEAGDDTIDMTPDVFVGRFPARTAAHVQAMVTKTIDYERAAPSSNYAERMLLIGVKLWDEGDAENKSERMYSEGVAPYWM